MISLQHAVNQFVNFKRRFTIIVEITVAWKFNFQKSEIVVKDHQKCVGLWSALCACHTRYRYCYDNDTCVHNFTAIRLPKHVLTAVILVTLLPSLTLYFYNQGWPKGWHTWLVQWEGDYCICLSEVSSNGGSYHILLPKRTAYVSSGTNVSVLYAFSQGKCTYRGTLIRNLV